MQAHWEHFPHQADIGIRGIGATLAEAFEQAAIAMTAVITDPNDVLPQDSLEIDCEAPDHELLLTDWLNAIILKMASRHMLFCSFDVTIINNHLHARIHGERIDRVRHLPAVEVKGATYTQLQVTEEPGQYMAQCVVDV
jgi:SHS2 domain-containing protein